MDEGAEDSRNQKQLRKKGNLELSKLTFRMYSVSRFGQEKGSACYRKKTHGIDAIGNS